MTARLTIRVSTLLVLSTFLLAGCSRAPLVSSIFETYQNRLGNLLDVQTDEIQWTPLDDFPDNDTLAIEYPDISLNLREFNALNPCHLSKLIGERNSALGKIQAPSLRYIYEQRVNQALISCIDTIEDESLHKKLIQWQQIKSESVQLARADLLQNSQEVRHHLGLYAGHIAGSEDDGLNDVYTALQSLLKQPQLDATEIESALKTLKRFPLFSQIRATQQAFTHHFEQSNPILQAASEQLDCNSASDKQTAEYLNNVFGLFFAKQLQPIAARLNQYVYKLSPIYQQLMETEHLASDSRQLLASQQQEFTDYQASLNAHVVVWQKLFKACDLLPATGK